MSELVIRQAEHQDLEAIVHLEKTCFSTPWSRESLEHELTKNKMAYYIVAEQEGQVIAYAGLWIIVDEGHITNIAVLPEYRGNHIASLILAFLIATTTAKGVVRFTLEVRSSNEAAKALYRKFEFKEEGLRKGYYEDTGEDAVIMWRDPNEPLKN